MRPKTLRRLLLVGILLVLAGAGAATLYGVRKLNRARFAQTSYAEGKDLLAKGDYYSALSKFKKYLEYRKNDREALLLYAQCREKIEEPNGSHIVDAAKVYQLCYGMDRTDRKTALHLLDLYSMAGMNAEVRNLALQLRDSDLAKTTADDLFVLNREIAARILMDRNDDSLEAVMRRVLELAPEDFATRVLLTEWLRDRGRLADAKAEAQRFIDANKADPRGGLMMALARLNEVGYDAQGNIFASLCEITGLDPVNAGIRKDMPLGGPLETLRYAALFDTLGRYNHSTAVLQIGTRQTNDTALRRAMTRRMWMLGRANDVVTQTQAASLATDGEHTETLVYRALALRDLGQDAEARQIAAALANRKGDYLANAWGKAFSIILSEQPISDEQRLITLREAQTKAPLEPVITAYLGDVYQALGRPAEARQEWERAGKSPLALGWTLPWLRNTYQLLSQGRPQAAYESAMMCARMAPRAMTTYAAVFSAQIGLIQAGYAPMQPPEQMLSTAERLDNELALAPNQSADIVAFRDALTPGRALLTSRVKGKTAAAEIVKKSLARTPQPSPEVLEQFARVDALENLGTGELIVEALERANDGTPRAVMARARLLARTNKSAEALALLDQAVAAAGSSTKQAFELARAEFLDAVDDPKAAEAWAKLTETYKDNLSIQLAAVRSPAVVRDRELVKTITARTRALGLFERDIEPTPLRLARARSLLSGQVTAEDRQEAIALLDEIVLVERDWMEARVLLTQALLMNRPEAKIEPMDDRAIEQIRALIPLSPQPDRWTLELARLQMRKGEVSSARTQLDRIANGTEIDPEIRLSAVDELIKLRELASAQSALERLVSTDRFRDDPEVVLRLAGVLRALRRDNESLLAYRQAAELKLRTPEQFLTVADGLAGLGDAANAKKVLDGLGTLNLEPGIRETVLARYAQRRGDPAEAARLLEQAVTLAPQRTEGWTNLVAFYVERGEQSQAQQAIERASQILKDSAVLDRMRRNLALASDAAATGEFNLKGMAEAIKQSGGDPNRADALLALERMRGDGTLYEQASLQQFRERYRNDAAVLTLAAQLLLASNPPRVSQASEVLRAAVRDNPASVEPAQLATRVFRQQQNWTEMRSAAKAWQQLTREPEADLAVAEALMQLDQREAALEEVKPYVKAALENPTREFSLRVLDVHARTLVRGGRNDEARTLLEPLMAGNQALRNRVWLPIAGSLVKPAEQAAAWVDRARGASSSDEQDALAIATAYAGIAARFPQQADSVYSQTVELLRAAADKPGSSARIWEALGQAHMLRKDNASARTALERARQLDPKSSFARRASAQMLIETDPVEALSQAESALALTGNADLETQNVIGLAAMAVARAKEQRKDAAGARQASERAAEAFGVIVAAQPTNAGAILNFIAAKDGAGRIAETLPYFETLMALGELPRGVDRAGVQNNYADAIVRSGRTGTELDRALAMAQAAVKAMPVAATLDTLASVQRARGDRIQAIATYREALAKDKTMVSARIGLAKALAEGTADEKAQAAAIAAALKSEGVALPAELADKLK